LPAMANQKSYSLLRNRAILYKSFINEAYKPQKSLGGFLMSIKNSIKVI